MRNSLDKLTFEDIKSNNFVDPRSQLLTDPNGPQFERFHTYQTGCVAETDHCKVVRSPISSRLTSATPRPTYF